ncbi:SpoIIE family protein phosphatase [Paracrocinitomix mangrovi]|uniref:two-component regulator propeller domain-containing protein n=1 Tax=Paracrocinitomix mangrovi TaxID=2862509 RepID=UPI001C8D2FE2|nr:two-component regulator propeller domain-containing protein [Paracrocinitomix mangrovi]UKN00488.1 SpoIIE family protein phosphatase [Paracrocinitomix mangrovi]
MKTTFKTLFFLVFLTACQTETEVDVSAEQSALSEEYNGTFINQQTGDTIPTGEFISFDNNGVAHENGRISIEHKGRPYGTVEIPFRKNEGYIKEHHASYFNLDSAIVPDYNDTLYLPPAEVFIEPKIVSVKEPQQQHLLPARYKDNAQYDIRTLTKDEGLPSNMVLDIMVDANEYVWMATDKGLVKYDGRSIKTYDEKAGLPESNITCLAQDLDNNIWFGTRSSGVIKYDGMNFTIYPIDSIALAKKINHITFDHDNELWMTIEFGGFAHFDGTKFYKYQQAQGVVTNRPTTSVCVDPQNRKWISGFGTSGYVIDENNVLRILHSHHHTSTGSTYINVITMDKNGQPYFSHWSGYFAHLDSDTIRTFRIEGTPVPDLNIDIYEDKENNLWLAGYGRGLFRWNRNTNELNLFGEEEGMNSRYVVSMDEDQHGGLWVSTENGGVSYFKKHSFTSLNQYTGLENNLIYSVKEFPNGTYYYASQEGVMIHDTSGLRKYNQHFVSRDIMIKPDTSVWIMGLNGGPIRVKSDGTAGRFGNGFGWPYNPTCVDTSSNGDIWMAGNFNPLTHVADTAVYNFSYPQGLYITNYRDLLITDKDEIWIASEGQGAAVIIKDSIKYLTKKEGMLSMIIHQLSEDKNGRIWMCTEKGLNYYEDGVLKRVDHPLMNRNIMALIQDKENRYWITTDHGILVLVPNESVNNQWDLSDYQIQRFDKSNGITSIDFIQGSIFIDSENRIMMGSEGGLIIRDLDNLNFDKTPPKCYLETVYINGHFVDYKNLEESDSAVIDDISSIQTSGTEDNHNIPKSLELPHTLNHLTFEFSGINWKDPDNLQFKYYLEGFEKDWNISRDNNTADYRNLSYGKYTFHLKTIARDGTESETTSFSFEINRPWWHAWWARILFLLIIIGIVFGIIKWRTLELRRRQKVLENEIELATESIRKQKEIVESQKEKVEAAHEVLNTKNQEILDSIMYAKRIQNAIMPSERMINEAIPSCFVLYKPKDIVAGDFYWMEEVGDDVLLAAADCTGHGVPGAMVSVICNNGLNRAVREFGFTDPALVLNKTRELVIEEFQKSDEGVKDGMDIALIKLNKTNGKIKSLDYAGANNPLWVIRKGTSTIAELEGTLPERSKVLEQDGFTFIEIKADKQPIGIFEDQQPYTTHHFDLMEGDTIFIFSDGYADQFGGDKGKKMKAANFKELLMSVQNQDIENQIKFIETEFEKWKGEFEQLDDVCVIGVRV